MHAVDIYVSLACETAIPLVFGSHPVNWPLLMGMQFLLIMHLLGSHIVHCRLTQFV